MASLEESITVLLTPDEAREVANVLAWALTTTGPHDNTACENCPRIRRVLAKLGV